MTLEKLNANDAALVLTYLWNVTLVEVQVTV